jgi:hypothetical protein
VTVLSSKRSRLQGDGADNLTIELRNQPCHARCGQVSAETLDFGRQVSHPFRFYADMNPFSRHLQQAGVQRWRIAICSVTDDYPPAVLRRVSQRPTHTHSAFLPVSI